MVRSTSALHMESQFDGFLFASIGEERNGMLLSVLSALARLDLDPREEAARLARLPKETATQLLASMIERLPDCLLAPRDPSRIAARLIALLPRQVRSDNRSGVTSPGVVAPAGSRVLLYAIFMVGILVSQWIQASHQAPAPAPDPSAATSSTASPQTSPSAGR